MLGSVAPPARHVRAQPGGLPVIVVALVIALGLGVGLVFRGLLATIGASSAKAATAERVLTTALKLDGLEWRAIAGEPLPPIVVEFNRSAEQLRTVMERHSDSSTRALAAETEEYIGAVLDEFDAIGRGDEELAAEIDETRVDPAFGAVRDRAAALAQREWAGAAATRHRTELLAWLTVAGSATLVSAGVWAMLRQRDRRVVRAQELVAARRFQSLIESSTDVITVVSDGGGLTVMSPTLGFLAGIVLTDRPSSIAELVPTPRRRDWADADDAVAAGFTAEPIYLQLGRDDGSITHVELSGWPLAGEPDQRVWVWRDISARMALEAELSHRAFHDPLTGLANRALLHDRVAHALDRAERTAEPVAVLLCDLDDFKTVNDVLGHNSGDELLIAVASRMAGCLRSSDTLARLGGDEFAVLLESTDEETAGSLASRLITMVGEPMEIGEREVFPSMSVGIAHFELGATTDELLRRADVAMYEAKRGGKGRAEVFRHGQVHVGNDALLMQSELRRAVMGDGLSLAYQPTVSLVDGSVSSVEALVRWNHPNLGPIPPATFVPMAEDSGLIVALGRWVLREACRAAVTLRGTDGSGLTMHVNVSPHQLNDPTFVPFVKETLAEIGLEPHLLVLEVTEGALLSNATAVDRLLELRGHGVRLAIDDFGTGYASITYLQRLPIDILKIDRAFVSGDTLEPKERRALLHTIIDLANNLQMTSVAEGVETEEQRVEVAGLGCDRGQGYLWARPVDLDTLRSTIAELGRLAR